MLHVGKKYICQDVKGSSYMEMFAPLTERLAMVLITNSSRLLSATRGFIALRSREADVHSPRRFCESGIGISSMLYLPAWLM